ncbi:hypothetical protein KKI24_22610 [bacterium]|nr:hypothetical protein [bacterium]
MTSRSITDSVREYIRELYLSDHSCYEIAALVGVSSQSAYNICKEAGIIRTVEESKAIARRKNRLKDWGYSPKTNELVNLLLNEINGEDDMIKIKGKSLRQQAKDHGIPESTVQSRWNRGIRDEKKLFAKEKLAYPKKHYHWKGQDRSISEIAELEGKTYIQIYRIVTRDRIEEVEEVDYEAELAGRLPVTGLFEGCRKQVIRAMQAGDFKEFLRATG